jgi:hypothetical protein
VNKLGIGIQKVLTLFIKMKLSIRYKESTASTASTAQPNNVATSHRKNTFVPPV